MALLEVNDLSLGYDGKAIAEHLNFKVDAGSYLCIVGENGSGKTTLMKTLLHLQKPLSGTINYGDGLKPDEIGYLPQQTEVQRDFPASVYEIVISGCQSRLGRRAFYGKEEKALAADAMRRMAIEDLKDRCYRDLSGGQQQRVLLARALCAARKIILLDEPVSGLDPKVTAELYKLIEDLNREGVTIMMVSHDISTALRNATHILHIGSEMFFGTRQEYLSSKIGRKVLEQEGGEN
jgi:zinc transport system ATP-binding protein